MKKHLKKKSKKKLVSVIIVNFNGREYLKDCLDSLFKNNYPNFEVILVDNNSKDGSIDFVNEKYPQVEVIPLNKNYGFAKGNQIGVKSSKGDLLLFLNNDTVVTKSLISNLVKFYEKTSNCGIVQPKIRILNNPKYLDGAGSFLTIGGFLLHIGHKQLEKDVGIDKPQKVFSVKGACMLVSRQIFEKVGGFDEKYFAYHEEADLCWRIILLGKKNYYYPEAEIYHAIGRTTAKLPLYFIEYHSFKNRIATLIKNLELKSLLYVLPLNIALSFLFITIYLFRLKIKNIVAIFRAFSWNLANLQYLVNKRRKIQKFRKIPDSTVFRDYLKSPGMSSLFGLTKAYFFKRGKHRAN